MSAVAMTDNGQMFGAVHFVNAAKQQGMKPSSMRTLRLPKK